MQPEVAAGETITFPPTSAALTDDAPQRQGASSRPAPVAWAALNASTATIAAMTMQALTRTCRPQNLTTRGCRAATPNAMGRMAHLLPRRVPSSPQLAREPKLWQDHAALEDNAPSVDPTLDPPKRERSCGTEGQ
jgi:hypothetical protein